MNTKTNNILEEHALKEGERMEMEKEAEESLCGAVIRKGEVYEQVREIVKVEDFRFDKLGWLWQAFENLHNQQLKIDQFTAADELQRMGKLDEFVDGAWSGRMYLSNLWEHANPRNAMTYARNVKNYANKRHIEIASTRWYEWAKNGRRDEDIVKDIMADLSKIVIPGSQDEYTVHLKDALSEAWDWSVQAAQGKLPGVPTGFIDLDKLLKTMIAGNVYIAAGRPGMGKTAFLLTIALHAAKAGKKVLIFSLEMSRMQVAQRLISQIAQVDLEKVINAEEMDMAEWDRVGKAIEQLEAYGIVINDLSEINIRQIRQTSRKVKAEQGVDLVIVDYLQLAEGDDDKYESRVQEVSKVSRGLKYLARELEVPVLAAAQLNREVEKRADKRPILADLRESGQLEQDAYAIMFLFKANPDTEPNVVTVDVAKHRNGKVGAIELIFRGEFTKFENAVAKHFRPNE